LQLLLDALHAQLLSVDAVQAAMRIEPLVSNAAPFCSKPEDRFKVWPTNRDRGAFNAVMAADPPIEYDAIAYSGERMVEAHRYFSEQARDWLTGDGPQGSQTRAAAIETVARELLQMVVIDLGADENAQEIFETLNARGAQLTAADLIKNFIFQRLLETETNVEDAYQNYWKEFETGFWETEISLGRLRYPRSAIFLNHWLIARTGEEIVAREVFNRFKIFADHDAELPMHILLQQIRAAAGIYRDFVTKSSLYTGQIDRLGLFSYRTGVLESEVVKPLVLCLLDSEAPPIPSSQLVKALDVIESWMVRRMLMRATTKSYNQVIAEIVSLLRTSDRATAGDAIENYLARQTSASRYWPDDAEVEEEVATLLAYRRLGRGRLRMVLEAIEDHLRGWCGTREGLGGERVTRGKLAIEHVMPRKWHTHWPLQNSVDEADRDRVIHTLGNLTLLTGKLNSKVSNGPWLGSGGKQEALRSHDVLFLNRGFWDGSGDQWTDEKIRERARELARLVIQIWPVPANHKSGFTSEKSRPRKKVQLIDLIVGGALSPGMSLFPRRKHLSHHAATLLPDGQVELNGIAFPHATDAATAIVGKRTNGWRFFLTDQTSRRSLRDVRRDYVNAMAVDAEDEDPEDDDEDEDA
jgi:hypothetical protein